MLPQCLVISCFLWEKNTSLSLSVYLVCIRCLKILGLIEISIFISSIFIFFSPFVFHELDWTQRWLLICGVWVQTAWRLWSLLALSKTDQCSSLRLSFRFSSFWGMCSEDSLLSPCSHILLVQSLVGWYVYKGYLAKANNLAIFLIGWW